MRVLTTKEELIKYNYTHVSLMVGGNTYGCKENLKADGFRWVPEDRCWSKDFPRTDYKYVKLLAESMEASGELECWIA